MIRDRIDLGRLAASSADVGGIREDKMLYGVDSVPGSVASRGVNKQNVGELITPNEDKLKLERPHRAVNQWQPLSLSALKEYSPVGQSTTSYSPFALQHSVNYLESFHIH